MTGRATVRQPVNSEQVRAAFGTFIARRNDEDGTVTVEVPDRTDQQVAAGLAGIVYDPNVKTVEQASSDTLHTRLDQALTDLRTFIDSAKPSTAGAQASAAYDAAKLLARIAVGLIRLRLRRLDATD